MRIIDFLNNIKSNENCVNFLGISFKLLDNDIIIIKANNKDNLELTRFNFGTFSTQSNIDLLDKDFNNFTLSKDVDNFNLYIYLDYESQSKNNLNASIKIL